MADVFVEPEDPFSPQDVADVHAEYEKDLKEKSDLFVAYVERRARAYANVFNVGDTDQSDLDFVMLDLATFCYAFKPTFDLNSKRQDLKEGRREVYMRIAEWSGTPAHILLQKSTQETPQ